MPSNRTQKSKSRLVRILLRVRPVLHATWALVPASVSRMCLRWWRNSDSVFGYGIRYLSVARLAESCGEKVVIFPHVYFEHLNRLRLGTNVSIHQFCYLDAHGGITIGDNVAIAHNCSILSSDHEIDQFDVPMKDAAAVLGEIVIEDDVWLGAGCRILKGVRLGRGCVIAAGAVVTRDIPANAVAAGVPARVIRQRRPSTAQ